MDSKKLKGIFDTIVAPPTEKEKVKNPTNLSVGVDNIKGVKKTKDQMLKDIMEGKG